MLVDTHAHLEMLGDGAPGAVERASEAGVGAIVSMSTDPDSAVRTLALAERFEPVYAAVGVHPHSASVFGEGTVENLANLASNGKVVAIGETGLDYHYMKSERGRQIESFEALAGLAGRLGLPVVVHVRESADDVESVLKAKAGGDRPGVIHCFADTYETAKRFLDLGFFISFSGILTFKNAPQVRETAKQIPSDRILIETDSPYLAPVPVRGKDNEPAFVRHVFDVLAGVRGETPARLEDILFRNSAALFAGIKA